MRKMYIEKGILQEVYKNLKNQKKVATHFGVSLKVIKRLCSEYKLETFENRRQVEVSKEELLYLYKTHTQKEISKLLNISLVTVIARMQEYGIKKDKSAGKFKKLSKEELGIIVGSLLGDGYIGDRSLSLNHSIKQLDYLLYKKDLLKAIIKPNSKSEDGIYYRKKDNKIISARIRTEYIDGIGELREKFYTPKKIVPLDIEKYLTPMCLAIWYLDDGCRKGKGYGNIATCSFSEEEVDRLCEILNRKYNLNTRTTKEHSYTTGNDYYFIKLPAKHQTFEKFCNIIRPFVPQCMQYKIIT